MMKKLLVPLVLIVSCAASFAAPPGRVQPILDRVNARRPTAEDATIYSLDWSPTLVAARERAAREGRPIFLALVTNSFGDIASGHC